ncbi:hypothetical protein K437DRAFT_256353 [Tilletiaria anomala UBC 951]|uniref:Zn(2)-C6 fungal-type domain-containing protein n=1 Tax=Tilletiaria anomala (strain ATCC 24038 / CBS 436.72 / UBC 951) TaxID=1037660 RepID=A0A066W598_TILAU|nr:uncharacterized protein K437DRAFT_256353 [Tilletiaria anomala UBC 951]KDN45940.1 hypothetical protein K437DRAFT_256353 [Tilletiaria anomala UBC 951]
MSPQPPAHLPLALSLQPTGADDVKATELHSSLRQRRNSAGPSACDSCRTSKSKCDKRDPCARCVQAKRECKRTHVLLRTGRVSRAERMTFELSGLSFKTWRHRLAEQRRQYGHEMRLTTRALANGSGTSQIFNPANMAEMGTDDGSTVRSRSSSISATSTVSVTPAALAGPSRPNSSTWDFSDHSLSNPSVTITTEAVSDDIDFGFGAGFGLLPACMGPGAEAGGDALKGGFEALQGFGGQVVSSIGPSRIGRKRGERKYATHDWMLHQQSQHRAAATGFAHSKQNQLESQKILTRPPQMPDEHDSSPSTTTATTTGHSPLSSVKYVTSSATSHSNSSQEQLHSMAPPRTSANSVATTSSAPSTKHRAAQHAAADTVTSLGADAVDAEKLDWDAFLARASARAEGSGSSGGPKEVRLRALPDPECEALFPNPPFSRCFSELKLQLPLGYPSKLEAGASGKTDTPKALVLGSDNQLHLIHDASELPTATTIFSHDWTATSAIGTTISPPWQPLRDDVPIDTLTLWPPLKLKEEDFDDLRAAAFRLIAGPVLLCLVKRYFAQQHLVFPFLFSPQTLHYLDVLIMHVRGGHQLDWTPMQIRQRQALLLSIAAAAVHISDDHTLELVDDADANADDDASTGTGTSAKMQAPNFYSRQWALEAIKLAYALTQPLDDMLLRAEEKTLDLVLAARTWLLSIGTHPCLEGVIVLASKLALADPHFHMCILLQSGNKIEEFELWKRVVCDGFMAQNHHKLWRDVKYEGDLGTVLKGLGPLRLIPGELLDEKMGGASSRACMWYYFRDAEFQHILSRLCNSCLCNPPVGLPEGQLAAQREIEAEEIFDALKQWNEQTFGAHRGDLGCDARGTLHERRALRYMAFSARAKLSAALDIIMCALESVDTLGLEELRLFSSPAEVQPDEKDKVASWITSTSFYRTEKSFIRSPRKD